MIIHERTKETPAALGARFSQGVRNRGARRRQSHAEDAGTSPRGLFGKDVTSLGNAAILRINDADSWGNDAISKMPRRTGDLALTTLAAASQWAFAQSIGLITANWSEQETFLGLTKQQESC